ncbi:MAG: MurR/RpiR family transcriptional regulator [Brevibacterium sp.]
MSEHEFDADAATNQSRWFAAILDPATLTKSQRRVAEVILRNPRLASFADTAELAQRSDVNNSTVVRTAQALGYRGWPDLQRELRARYLATISSEDTLIEHGSYQSPLHDALEHDIDNLRHTGEAITGDEATETINALAFAANILVLGYGSFAGPAGLLAHLGSTMGYSIAHEARGNVHLASALNSLGNDDVLLVVNMWRLNKQSVLAAESARAKGTTIVAITDMRHSRIADTADHLLVVPSEGISFFQSITAATSVIYGLLAGMEAAHPERSRTALRRTQQLWKDLDVYSD